mgnify:CR=1 FL=1
MQSFGKFTPYIPDTTDRPKIIDGQNVLFLQDDKGNDWYDVIKLFDESSETGVSEVLSLYWEMKHNIKSQMQELNTKLDEYNKAFNVFMEE